MSAAQPISPEKKSKTQASVSRKRKADPIAPPAKRRSASVAADAATRLQALFRGWKSRKRKCVFSCVLLPAAKNEDASPRCAQIGGKIVFVVADGHGGKGCRDIINGCADTILGSAAEHGPLRAMELCISLCHEQSSGAMIVIGAIDGRTLTTASVGDASMWVFDKGECVFKQPHHDKAFFDAYVGGEKENMFVGSPVPTILANANGTCQSQWGHYFYPQGCAAAAALGHLGKLCLPPIVSTVELSEHWSVVACSDGVSDVVHPAEIGGLSVEDIAGLAHTRWIHGIQPAEGLVAVGPKQIVGNDDISVLKIVG